ncbi:MAG TPA: hypothetical protein VLI04_08250 [Nocardioidaceae bacterium]|nr:hypothetical protein [Nocardioidaceae bacterium]
MKRHVLAIAIVGLALLAPGLPAVAITDHKAPVIKGASLSRDRADVTLADRRIKARVRITDNTGVDYVQVYLLGKDDNPVLILTNPAERVSGTRRDGWYEASATIPRYFEAGLFRLMVDATDAYGNRMDRVYDDLDVRVIDRNEDTVLPKLRLLQPETDSRYNVRRQAVVIPVRVRSLDDKSGVEGLDICLTKVTTTGYQTQKCDWARKVRGDARDAVWEARIRIPKMSLGGIWNVEASLTDRAHPYDLWRWHGPELFEQDKQQFPDGAFKDYFPFPHDKGRIRVRGFSDTHPPSITKVTVTPTQLIEGVGGKVVVRAWAQDIESVAGVYAFAATDLSGIEAGSAELRLVRGTRKNGVWKGTFTVSASLPADTYYTGLNIWDRAHYIYYRANSDGNPDYLPVPGPKHIVVKPAA